MKKLIVSPILMFCIVLVSIKAYFDTKHHIVNTVYFETDKIPKGAVLTILQISDVHNKSFGKRENLLIKEIKSIDADIIVLTGDLISRDTKDFSNVYSFVEKITINHQQVFFVSGNHEWGNTEREVFFNGLRERDVKILDNRHIQIEKDSFTFNLVGIEDAATNHENMAEAFDLVYKENYTILLSHTPSIIEKYEEIDADLILSGHTHGGQIRFPFIGAVIAPEQGLLPKYDKGTFKISDSQFLYIDSGLGTSTIPVRLLNKSQVSVIQITNND